MNYFDVLLAKKLEDTRDPVVKGLSVTENGRYSEENTVYDVVVVDVPETRLTTLNATANGTYTPQEGEAYNEVNVDVPLPSNAYLLKSLTGLPQDIATFTDGADAPLNALTASIESSCNGADIIVAGNEIKNDKIPYIFRKSAGGDRVYEKLIGGTIAWNQLVRNGNFASTSGWLAQNSTISVTNNILSITSDTTSIGANALRTDLNIDSAHVVFASVEAKGNTSARLKVSFYGSGSVTQSTNSYSLTSSFEQINGIIKTNGTKTNYYLSIDKTTASDQITIDCKNAICIDLTQLFGSTIADYIYSLEQSTAGAGVAYFRQMFPNDYYAYDSGTLQSVNVASKKVYDSNNTLVATYTFDSDVTLRGIPKLDANNNLYYDGDVYESDGTVTRKYGVVDFDGSNDENWTTRTTGSGCTLFEHSLQNCNITPSTTQVGLCNEFPWNNNLSNDNSYRIQVQTLSVRKDGLTLAQFKTFLASSQLQILYPLATSTTESADTYINPQMVDADGTEEFVDYAYSQSTRDVAVPVGHDSYYYDGTLYSRDFPATISSGSYDIINGVITSGQNTYNTTPLPLRSLVGNNNIYVDCGEITNLEYFTKEQHE